MRPNIHTELEQLPVEVLTRYLSGGLSNDETVAVEEFLKENPMYADALEGLREMPNTTSTSVATHQLRHKTRGLLKKRVPGGRIKQFNFVQYATAAVAVLVVLFVASTALFFNPGAESKAVPTASAIEKGAPQSKNAQGNTSADRKNEILADAEVKTEMLDDKISENEEIIQTPESIPALPAPKSTSQTAGGASQSGAASSPTIGSTEVTDVNTTSSDTYSVPVSVNIANSPDLTEEQLKTYKNAITEKEYEKQIASTEREKKREEKAAQKDDFGAVDYGDDSYTDDVGADDPLADRDGVATTFDEAVVSVPIPQKEIQSAPAATQVPAGRINDNAQVLSEVQVTESRSNKIPRKSKDKQAKSQIPVLFPLPADSVSASLSQALAYYNNQQYTETVNILQQVLATSPDNYQARYYMGNSYQNMNQPALAVPYLKKVVTEPDSALFEVARWNLANAYLQNKNTRQAKKLLKEIAGDESVYKGEAKKKLEEL